MAKSSKDSSRSRRVAEQIRRDLAQLLQLEIKDPRVAMVTLTDVEVTEDYAHAKVFYTTLAEPEQRLAIAAGLAQARGFLRRELGRRIKIHHLPELHFIHDTSVEHGMHLAQLIDAAVQSALSDPADPADPAVVVDPASAADKET